MSIRSRAPASRPTRALAIVALVVFVSACSPSDRAAPEGVETEVPSTSATTRTSTSAPGSLAAVEVEPTQPEMPDLPPYGPGDGQLDLGWLADQAALVVIDRQADPGPGTRLDLEGLPNLADRVAIGLAKLGLTFTRSATADGSGHHGTVITVHDDATDALARWQRSAAATDAAADAGFDADEGADIRLQTRLALERRIDVELLPDLVELGRGEAWSVAASADPSRLATELTDSPGDVIAWSNREAQRYVADAVSFDEPGFSITTSSRRTPPSVTELPYDSGMVVSRENFGWGTFSTTVQLPEGDGLWPAIWLIDAAACEAPGRCSGYETSDYYEIDLIETRGQRPEEGHFSVHWRNERIRSSSEIAPIDGSRAHLVVERRPGLLVWRVDGTVAGVVAERVETFDHGPHRAAPMRLVVNTAVGGTFAGTREIGRDGVWLGEALVPDSHPADLDATFRVLDFRVETLG